MCPMGTCFYEGELMIYVYVVILSMWEDGVPVYSVRAPNAVYKTEEKCQAVRELNMLYLLETSPSPTAEFRSLCVGMQFQNQKTKGDL